MLNTPMQLNTRATYCDGREYPSASSRYRVIYISVRNLVHSSQPSLELRNAQSLDAMNTLTLTALGEGILRRLTNFE